MEDYFNNNSLFSKLNKWKFHLFMITLTGGILSFILTLFIKPEYSSKAVLYPVNLGEYSEESHTEQMIQLINSDEIKDKIIDSFDLINHYGIDTTKKDYKNLAYYYYNKNIDIKKTQYEAVEISCKDKVPEIAAQIIDSIISFYNQKAEALYRRKVKEIIIIVKNDVIKYNNKKDSLLKVIYKYQEKYGIIDYKTQVKEIIKKIYRGKNVSSKDYDLLNNLSKYGLEHKSAIKMLNAVEKRIIKTTKKMNKAEKEYNKKINYAQVVSKPTICYKKVKTKQILYTILGFLFSFLIAIITVTIAEISNNKIKYKSGK